MLPSQAVLAEVFGEDAIALKVAKFQHDLGRFSARDRLVELLHNLYSFLIKQELSERDANDLREMVCEVVSHMASYNEGEDYDQEIHATGWSILMGLLAPSGSSDATLRLRKSLVAEHALPSLIELVKKQDAVVFQFYGLLQLLPVEGDLQWNHKIFKTVLDGHSSFFFPDVQASNYMSLKEALLVLDVFRQELMRTEPDSEELSSTLTKSETVARVLLKRYMLLSSYLKKLQENHESIQETQRKLKGCLVALDQILSEKGCLSHAEKAQKDRIEDYLTRSTVCVKRVEREIIEMTKRE